jgi:hypothetical protein
MEKAEVAAMAIAISNWQQGDESVRGGAGAREEGPRSGTAQWITWSRAGERRVASPGKERGPQTVRVHAGSRPRG